MVTNRPIIDKIESSPSFTGFSDTNKNLLKLFYDNASTSMFDIAKLVQQDNACAESILRTANSPQLGLNGHINSVKDALTILGTESACLIIVQEMIFNLADSKNITYRTPKYFCTENYWRHILAVAILADKIGCLTKHEDVFRLFIYGLLHDLGTVVLDACTPELLDDVEDKISKGIHPRMAEKVVFNGLTHTEIGSWVCLRWNLGEDLNRIIQYHHEPFICEDLDDDLCILHISDVLGERYYRSRSSPTKHSRSIDSKVLEHLSICPYDLMNLESQLPGMVESFLHNAPVEEYCYPLHR